MTPIRRGVPRRGRKSVKLLPLLLSALRLLPCPTPYRPHKNGATLIVIDSPPHFRPGVDILASAADFLLIPCRPSAFDLAAIATSTQIAKAAKKPGAFILNACESRAPEVDKAKEFLKPHGFPIAPVNIGNRRAFSRAIITGSAVTEFEPKGKAAQEITQLWQWIAKQIGKQDGKK